MDRSQILELALEELQRQKSGIDAEIEAIRAELGSTGIFVQNLPSPRTRRGRKRSPAERKRHSDAMRKYWAAKKKAQAARPATKTKTAPDAGAKQKTSNEARRKAISAAMKRAWKKRKMAADEKSQSKGTIKAQEKSSA